MNKRSSRGFVGQYRAHRSGQALGYLVLGLCLVVFTWLAFLSEHFAGGGDTITHYLFSRYAWEHPQFLLDHWAKPVFTLVSSPFAQAGLRGVVLMNVLLGVASAWLAWQVARSLGMAHAWAVPLLTCFLPVYAETMLSGLTEILFGFMMILSLWLLQRSRYHAAALVAGFSFLVRTEGILVMPIVGWYLLALRQQRAMAGLFTGFITYSLVGWAALGEPFWLITHMPYRGAVDLYGTGPLLHFARHAPVFFGALPCLLILTGIIAWGWQAIRIRPDAGALADGSRGIVMLGMGMFLVYFLAHSFMWWSGTGSSLGLHRYMAALGPLAAVLALAGFNALTRLAGRAMKRSFPKAWATVLLLLVLGVVAASPFSTYPIPGRLQGPDLIMKQAARFILEQSLDHNKVYYYDPALVIHLDLNPYDPGSARERIFSNQEPESGIETGSIVVWDAHFAVNNGLEAGTLIHSPYFRLLQEFEPEQEILVFDRPYRVMVFQRNTLPGDGAGS